MHILDQCREVLGFGELYELRDAARLLKAEKCQDNFVIVKVQRLAEEAGYRLLDSWKEYGSEFLTYVKDAESLHISYHERINQLSLVSDCNVMLPQQQADEAAICTPLLTQVHLMYFSYNNGMCYVIRLGDGRFVVIDGGMAEYEEVDRFFALLNEQNVRTGKPEIAMWFITHPHDDHSTLFETVVKGRRDELIIDALAYNWANTDYAPCLLKESFFSHFEESLAACKDEIPIIHPHTGQRFCYSGVTFRVLYTHEDACPGPILKVNDSSIVMRMDVKVPEKEEVRRVMLLGDAQQLAAGHLCRQYDPRVLKCEITQVCHHGFNGGSAELYETIGAEIILWPVADCYYRAVREQGVNQYFAKSPNVKAVFFEGNDHTIIDFTQPILPVDPYSVNDALEPGDTLYEETFSGNSIYDLHWRCVGGGCPKFSLSNGCCHVQTGENTFILELLEPGYMRGAKRWAVTLKGKVTHAEKVSLMWDYHWLKPYDPESVLDLPMQSGEAFDFLVKVDDEAAKAELYADSVFVQEFSFPKEWQKGIYLILAGAEIYMEYVKVVKE